MSNRTFFKNAQEGHMSLQDIFSDLFKKHTPEETASVFIAGTELTTPKKEEMLSGWIKPFLFAKFFVTCVIGLGILFFLASSMGYGGAVYLMMIGIPCVVPVTTLLFVWEMHIPRNISLPEVIKILGAGGVLSIFAAIIGFSGVADMASIWAGFIEEPAKLLIIYFLLKKKNRVYILDGILLGMAVGTGFAMFESLIYTMGAFEQGGASYGLAVALVRAFSAISGHGLYAALYGGALVMAKGEEEVSPNHLLSFTFLKYFAIAIVLHAFHNMGINVGLPKFFGGLLWGEWIVETIIAVSIFLSLLKVGVNQIVDICAKANGGRVTNAVKRGAQEFAGPQKNIVGSSAQIQLEGVAGPCVGQIYRISQGRKLTIGRLSGKNDIAIPSCQNVSSIHCEVSVDGDRVYVMDLNSTNGTYIGEQRAVPNQKMPVSDGSMIYLGNKSCGFRVRIH